MDREGLKRECEVLRREMPGDRRVNLVCLALERYLVREARGEGEERVKRRIYMRRYMAEWRRRGRLGADKRRKAKTKG
jgi:hypothetical protein